LAVSWEKDELEQLIKDEARKIAERDLRRIQRLIRKELKELHDPDQEE
jgi:hypothetical protein